MTPGRVLRAGRCPPSAPSYNALTTAKFPRSVRKIPTRATSAQLTPQSARIAPMLASTWRVSASIPPHNRPERSGSAAAAEAHASNASA